MSKAISAVPRTTVLAAEDILPLVDFGASRTKGIDVDDFFGDVPVDIGTSENLRMVPTTATTGAIYCGADRFIHTFKHPTGGGAVPDGNNDFFGIQAGNLTMGSGATETFHASGNVGVGFACTRELTTGYFNTAVGYKALTAVTTGYHNTALGAAAGLDITTGYRNICIGVESGYNTLVPLETVTSSIFIGHNAISDLDGLDNVVVIGLALAATKSNQVLLGNSAVVETLLRGRVGISTTAPAGELHIDQSVDSAAIPVLVLDQADISEGFINFVGSDRGVITGVTNSTASVRVEIGGVVHRLALYADA